MALQNPAAVAITGGTIAGLTSLGVTGTTTLFSGGTNPLTFTPNNITATGAYVSGSSGTFQINADLLTSVP
jgi:hypothetical protein